MPKVMPVTATKNKAYTLQKIQLKMENYVPPDQILCHAIRANNMELVKSIVDLSPSLLNKDDGYGYYPLNWCCSDKYIEMFKYLHQNGADINIRRDDTEPTLLHEAVSGSHFNLINYILDWCDPQLMKVKDSTLQHTPLLRAEMIGCGSNDSKKEFIIRLLKRYESIPLYNYNEFEIELLFDDSVTFENENEVRKIFSRFRTFDSQMTFFLKEEIPQETRTETVFKIQHFLLDKINDFCVDKLFEGELSDSSDEENLQIDDDVWDSDYECCDCEQEEQKEQEEHKEQEEQKDQEEEKKNKKIIAKTISI